ncbi:MAG: sigma-70 family RNA polymerase sigma factor [Anaerolineae bacterium]|nr:sigma-70 family RNA polymerase sigma factor [Anaerolineae bacterium]
MVVSTKELISRYQAGQTDLFEAIFDRYKDYVYRVAYSLTKHAAESEEVVQETFLDVLKALSRYDVDGAARFETWLYRVTSNRCKMRFRRKQLPTADWDEVGEQLGNLPNGHHKDDPEQAAQQAEMRRALWLAVGRLKDIYREVIVLRYGQGFSYQEIAEACEVSIGTVKSRLNAAHGQLQDMMAGDDTFYDQAGRRQRQHSSLLVLLCVRTWSAFWGVLKTGTPWQIKYATVR